VRHGKHPQNKLRLFYAIKKELVFAFLEVKRGLASASDWIARPIDRSIIESGGFARFFGVPREKGTVFWVFIVMDNYTFRKFKNRLFFALSLICVIIAIIPLLSILIEVIIRGASQINLEFLFSINGISPAIQGTLILIGLTSLIGIPLGIMSGIYLSEYGNNRYASWMRTFNDLLTEFPSIVVGITVSIVLVIGVIGSFSAIAGAVALSIMLIPIVARTTEESLKLVPNSVREASMALGVYRWKTILRVVLPAGKSGLITGALLAVARIAGETAPLIMTVLGSRYFFQGLFEPMASLPIMI
jgi:phosphate transport system permease protein